MWTQCLAVICALVMLSSCTMILDQQRLVKHQLFARVYTPQGHYRFQCIHQWHHPAVYLGIQNAERLTCLSHNKQAYLEMAFQDQAKDPFVLYSKGLLKVKIRMVKPKKRQHFFTIQASKAFASSQSEYIYFDGISREGIGLSGHWYKQSKHVRK